MLLVLFFVVIISLFLVVVLYGGMVLVSVKDFNFFKVSSFESGFKSVGKVQVSFSIHFFVMMLMFVVFDLEVVMLLGLVVSDILSVGMFLFLFMFVVGGLYLEWFYGKLVWLIYWMFLFFLL